MPTALLAPLLDAGYLSSRGVTILDNTGTKTATTSAGGAYFVDNPATGEHVALVKGPGDDTPTLSAVQDSIGTCVEMFASLKKTTSSYRAGLLNSWAKEIRNNKQQLAILMTLECGKPLPESLGEVEVRHKKELKETKSSHLVIVSNTSFCSLQYGASFLDYFAAECMR